MKKFTYALVLICQMALAADHASGFAKQVALAEEILVTQRISTAPERDIVVISASTENGIVLVVETVGSRNRALIITPVIEIKEDAIFIDCSYIRGVDSATGIVQVGGYCRGKSKATADTLVDATSDEHRLSYSASVPWLRNVKRMVNCKSPVGLAYAGKYFVRCQLNNSDSLTQSVSTTAFSSHFDKLFTVDSAEFAPMKNISNPKKLIFWQYKNESVPVIIEKQIDQDLNRE